MKLHNNFGYYMYAVLNLAQSGQRVKWSHTKTIRTQTSVPTSVINIICITRFIIVVK